MLDQNIPARIHSPNRPFVVMMRGERKTSVPAAILNLHERIMSELAVFITITKAIFDYSNTENNWRPRDP